MTDANGDSAMDEWQDYRDPTPGPWEVYSMSEDEGWPLWKGWQGSIRTTVDPTRDWVATTIYRKADALLMAAAPDLLAALADLVSPPFGHYYEWRQRGDAVDADAMDDWQQKRDKAVALLAQSASHNGSSSEVGS